MCATHGSIPCRCADIEAAAVRLARSLRWNFPAPPEPGGPRWHWREGVESFAREALRRWRLGDHAGFGVRRAVVLAFGEDAASVGETQKEG